MKFDCTVEMALLLSSIADLCEHAANGHHELDAGPGGTEESTLACLRKFEALILYLIYPEPKNEAIETVARERADSVRALILQEAGHYDPTPSMWTVITRVADGVATRIAMEDAI